MNKPSGKRGAAYLRISTEEQSVSHQTKAINGWLDERGLAVAPHHWITDEGWGRGDDDVRPGFARLLTLAEQSKIDWIVCYNSDRFGAATNLRFMRTLSILEAKGVELYSTTEPEMGNLASSDILPMIMSTLNTARSTVEIYNKAQRAIEGVVTHAGNAKGVMPAFGYDKVCLSPDGKEKWRLVLERHEGKVPVKTRIWPDGRTEEFRGAGNNPSPDAKDKMRLAQSVHADRIAAVRLIFELWTTRNIGVSEIAKILNNTPGINPPPNHVPKFHDQNIRQIISNPSYAYGAQVRFQRCHAQLAEWRGGKAVPIKKLPGQRLPKGRLRDRADWVLPPESERGGGIIDEATWEQAYTKLMAKPGKVKTPRNPDRWLSGLIFCQCGLPMRAVTQNSRSRNKLVKTGYACRSYYMKGRRAGVACRRNFIRESILETTIINYLKDTGERLAILEKTPAAVVIAIADELVAESPQGVTLGDVLPKGDPYRECAVALDDGTLRYAKLLARMWREVGMKGKNTTAATLTTAYQQKHAKEATRTQQELTDAETRLDQMVENFGSLKPGIARDRLQTRIEEQEKTVAEMREHAVPLSDRLAEAASVVSRCREALSEVRRVLVADDGVTLKKRHGEALRRLVRQIVVKFRSLDVTTHSGGTMECSTPTQVVVVPMVGESRDYPQDAEQVPGLPLRWKR